MANIAFAVPHAEHEMTEKKYLRLALALQAVGHDITVIAWVEDIATQAAKLKLPCLLVQFPREPINVIATAQEFVAKNTFPLFEDDDPTPTPTLGELIGFDDFLGVSAGYRLEGANAFKPDLIVQPIIGSEAPIAEDQYLCLQLWRYCRNAKIPSIGIECSSLTNPLRLNQFPVSLLLTHDDPRDHDLSWIAPETLRMGTAMRYLSSPDHSARFDTYLAQDAERLKQSLGETQRFLYLPFHLGYKESSIALLEGITPYVETLREAGVHLLISHDPLSSRRLLTEQDMISVGMQRWLKPWVGAWHAVQGMSPFSLAIASDGVLAPCESPLTRWCRQWDIAVMTRYTIDDAAGLALGVTLPEAVSYLLQEKK